MSRGGGVEQHGEKINQMKNLSVKMKLSPKCHRKRQGRKRESGGGGGGG